MARTPSHVFSTATSALVFPRYADYVPNQVPQVLERVVIQGGANSPDKFLRTPKGVATPITPAQYDFLVANKTFTQIMSDGFLSFGNAESDVDRAVRDMTAKDRSAPKTPEDFKRVPNNVGGMGIVTGRSVEEIARPG